VLDVDWACKSELCLKTISILGLAVPHPKEKEVAIDLKLEHVALALEGAVT
jgi:hypothetical protein